ncbi:MAG: glycosyltransferase family 1 protein, partial [Chloroflexi bacterium]|nr:glycosyltransferase family 1 protein [Chloroflexota bacterium]
YRGPSVVTVHDLGYVHFPEAHGRRSLAYLRWATRHNAQQATHLIADSEATRDDIIRVLGVPSERITVAHLGVDPTLAPVTDPARLAAVRARYGLPDEYLLFVGSIHPRKNLARLVDAYGRLWENGQTTAALALAGGVAWLPDTILERVRQSRAPVILTGYVPQEDMAALYSGAMALAFPSLAEGFGLPVVEAMACGLPVVASNASSLPEVVGDAGVLVNPLSVGDIANGLLRVVSDASLRADLRARGFERVRRFTWERTAATVLDVLDRLGRGDRVAAGAGR